ncbi:hypothetical protein (partial), partial [Candidatus Ichthyocystis hellenicum]
MFYTNSKYLNCCDNSGFECHNENIIAEEMECTTIIEEHEKNFQPTQHHVNKNINKALVSSFLSSTSLIALSMLEVTDATDDITTPCESNLLHIFCYVAGYTCRMINIKDKVRNNINISEILKEAFDNSSIAISKLPSRIKKIRNIPLEKKYDFYFSIPLIPSNITSNCDTSTSIASFAGIYIYDYTNNIDLGRQYSDYCVSDSTYFCSSSKPIVSIFSECCPGIESYITYPGLSTEKKIPTVSYPVFNVITESTTAMEKI